MLKPKKNLKKTKATHDTAQANFKRAKADFDKASSAFKKRLETVKADNKKRTADKRSIAKRAGVPSRYLDNVWVSTDASGTSNIYFGGVGEPAGPGHGHYAMDSNGKVTYKREPFDPHGSQNFTDVESRLEPNGRTSTYFGGKGKPDGDDHGHIVADSDGKVTYKRAPGEAHGPQNFT